MKKRFAPMRTAPGEQAILWTRSRMAKRTWQHIVADPKVCRGKLTFRGTRIFVTDVLEQVAEGMPWDEISREWRGSVTREAISEAIRVASSSLRDRPRNARQRAAE